MQPHPAQAAWQGPAARFLALDPVILPAGRRPSGWWAAIVPLIQASLPAVARPREWFVALDVRLLRLRRRIDALIVTDRAVLALLIRPEAAAFHASDRLAAEDTALDLADFHAGCAGLPVVPVLVVPNGARAAVQLPLALPGATSVIQTTRLLLPGLLDQIAHGFPPTGYAPAAWIAAPYRPVPALVEAACLLFARHSVTELTLARAGQGGLARTGAAVDQAVRKAQRAEERLVIFVTGNPGAGKTLCGLSLAFAPSASAAFLTANPTLVHVLREALVRDAVQRGTDRRAARQRTEGVIQALPAFRDHHLAHPGPPPESLVVIDEAQRCWSGLHAESKTRNRLVPLQDSEPGHLLDIMARRPGWSVLVCLLGGGQEIHNGEGGLAAWGAALAARPEWRALAPSNARLAPDPRQRLEALPCISWSEDLHLAAPVRAIHTPDAALWADAVLANQPGRAAAIAAGAGGVPFRITRSLPAMRRALSPRGTRTCGMVASSGARRLRAEGLGAVLPHQDDDAVARWFLDRWPDVRSAGALEVVASEFGVQGLELDHVGLCWDADLIRHEGAWHARRFRASAWTAAGPAAASNRLNAYRVLLTRARHGTVIWVPMGNPADPTRDPALYDCVATYLLSCGATALDVHPAPAEDAAALPEPALL